MKMMGGVGGFTGPFLIGALSDASGGSYHAAVSVLAALLLVASVMHLLFREPGAPVFWVHLLGLCRPACPQRACTLQGPWTGVWSPSVPSHL